MKELSIEEKAKRYDEALERAEKLQHDNALVTSIFPELKESEDMKMLKEIHLYLGWLNGRESIAPKGDYTINDMLTWIEKHSVQPRYNIGDVICDKSCTALNKEAQPNMEIVDIKNGTYICDKGSFPVSQQDEYELVSKKIDTKLNDDSVSNELREASTKHAEKELKNQTFPGNLEFELIYTFEEGAKWNAAQKPAWSEKYIADVFEKVGLAKIVREQSNDALTIALQDAMIELSKVTLQPMQEWTAEDEEELKIALDTLVKAGQHSSAKWLKNVCLVPQNKWKPSGVQMTVLDDVITNGHLPNVNEKILKGLQEQLRKLK